MIIEGKKHSPCDSLDQLLRTEPLSCFISNDNLSSWVQKITQLHSMNWEGDEGEGGHGPQSHDEMHAILGGTPLMRGLKAHLTIFAFGVT